MPRKTAPSKEADKFGVLTVNAILVGIVNDKPDGYFYPLAECRGGTGWCHYREDHGKPSCIVAHVLHRLGIPLDRVREGQSASGNYWLRDYFTYDALMRLDSVQKRQDAGETWRRAIR